DAEAAPRLRSLLRVLLEGRTALLVTHDLVDVLTLAEDVAVLEDGRLVAVGPRERILARPPTAFAARLVGKVLLTGRIDGRRLRLPDGAVVPGQIEGDLRDGDAAYALIDPATVELEVPGRRPDPEAGRTGHVAVADEIIGLDRIGARILVRGRHLAVEVPAETLLHTDLGSGTAVRFLIDPASTPLYPG
ncbi:MAG: hypothetical protein Q4G40_09680, partial [Brachybacterium sp.]|nr:hypothetical protein [Brachybacterium sp.]